MKNLIAFIIPFLFSCSLLAQLQIETIADSIQRIEAVTSFVGQGLSISNIVVNCNAEAFGAYTLETPDELLELGVENMFDLKNAQGLVFSTGEVSEINEKSDFFASTRLINDTIFSDPDLALISEHEIHDKCEITFDILPQFPYLSFNYIFASEEYPEYVCSPFDDIFGFFIAGEGINGNFANNAINMARIPDVFNPGFLTDEAVSVNSVNWGHAFDDDYSLNYCAGDCSGYYGCSCNCEYYIHNRNENSTYQNYIVFDGQTILLNAVAVVIPNQTYHLKMVIADIGDPIFDSGILIEAESLIAKEFGEANVSYEAAIEENEALEAYQEAEENNILEEEITPFLVKGNLAQTSLQIETAQKGELKIFNTLAGTIYHKIIEQGTATIDISNYTKGIYFIQLQAYGTGNIYTKKLVKQ